MVRSEIDVKNYSVGVLFRALSEKRLHLDGRTKAFQQSERGLMLTAAYSETFDALIHLKGEVADGRL